MMREPRTSLPMLPEVDAFSKLLGSVIFSDSGAFRVEACAASAVLPKTESSNYAARLGIAFHSHRELLATDGYRAAIEALPRLAAEQDVDVVELTRMARGCGWAVPRGALAEVSLAVLPDASVCRVEGGHGHYPNLPPGAFAPGQLDLMWAEPSPLVKDGDRWRCPPESTLWVLDYKTGDEDNVAPVDRNVQLRNLAYKAARWTGATKVMPAILFIGPHGTQRWDVPRRPLRDHHEWRIDNDLFVILRDMMARQERVAAQARILEEHGRPELLSYTTGSHCTYCKSRFVCPAIVAEMKALVGAVPGLDEMTPETLAHLAQIAPMLEAAASRVKDVLRDWVVTNNKPIPLPPGTVWGPHPVRQEQVVARRALPILEETLGHHALAALSSSKAAIARTARDAGFSSVEIDSLFGALRTGDAIGHVTETHWSAHRVEPLAPARVSDRPALDEIPEPSTESP